MDTLHLARLRWALPTLYLILTAIQYCQLNYYINFIDEETEFKWLMEVLQLKKWQSHCFAW